MELLERAVEAFKSRIPNVDVRICRERQNARLQIMGKQFFCVVKPSLTITDMLGQPDSDGCSTMSDPVLYVALNLPRKVLDYAGSESKNVLDCAGNFNIRYLQDNGELLFNLVNRGEPPIKVECPSAYPVFRSAGLKVVFFLLQELSNIRKPFRTISEETGVSLGTVKNVVDGLISQHFVKVEGRKRYLINVDRLLSLWSTNYAIELKPGLFLARMEFRTRDDRNNWTRLELPEGMLWGGETASALSDTFLTPGEYTIYADVPASSLVKNGVAIPDINGCISVYKKFWKGSAMSPVLVYSDLAETGNSRCIEAAERMKKDELKYLF